jgi:hypothetical protein
MTTFGPVSLSNLVATVVGILGLPLVKICTAEGTGSGSVAPATSASCGAMTTIMGSYAVLGYLSESVDAISDVQNYRRSLDLDTGMHTTSYSVSRKDYSMCVNG